jgi:hypothetical protein
MQIIMNEQRFERGFDAEAYVANLRNYRSLVKRLMGEAQADDDHVNAVRTATASWRPPVRATMMTEDWCGDSACNVPVMADFFARAEIPFRVFRGSEEEDLKEMYESEGADHIPVVSLWDGSGMEIIRWIEAPQAVAEKKEAWQAAHPEFGELYKKQKHDKQAAKEFASLYRQFLEEMAGWYRDGMWSETTREIVESAQRAEV